MRSWLGETEWVSDEMEWVSDETEWVSDETEYEVSSHLTEPAEQHLQGMDEKTCSHSC